MTNVIDFTTKSSRKGVASVPVKGDLFDQMLASEIETVLKATGLPDGESAIKFVSDFYRKYPALVEYARSQENLLRR
ncbi:hypothetical protein SHANETTE_203 [Bacillus phage Shanette]|uniref:Uncharacterized protein n=2 Tax=Siminovitchvirus TaxID=1918721 RepID=S5MAR9_9CAUD|nr:hypothetical protein AVV47_gp093 [Bacillus phage JL]YP_009216198.1 hypothetical protein AVV46_gp094 [Bacillus phage Shanette]AGR46869.1 hypothetical protein JL_203 [Bacillus phage JL]AGR47137.2 hypothetical protein SHANETTE_203 [Bacillus phage Shanette]